MASDQERFTEKCLVLHDLMEVQQLLEWDQQVMMPRKGAEQRGAHQAALARVVHERLADPALGDLIVSLEEKDLADDARADLREAHRAWERAVKVPSSLVSERAMAVALAQEAWTAAKPAGDFAAFRPHLERVLALTREMASLLNPEHPYDALLEEYEPGMTEDELASVFAGLKARILPLLDRILGAASPPDASILARRYPVESQEAFCRAVAGDLGYDFEAGRLDRSAHPFTNGTFRDVRITTRYSETFLNMALFGTIHETGHALYEQGLDPERFRTPSGQACSLGIHESQSRFWENVIGRSRPFWSHYFPKLRRAFPGALDGVGEEDFYRAVNAVKPSLIRVEADEVTYNLHILLRFELESALLKGTLEPGDLPEAWRAGMKDLLGIEPPSDREGVLQDIHWSAGLVGYFPTYALGNLYGGQFLQALRSDLPDLDGRIAAGDFAPVRDWLRRKIHVQGRRHLAPELCARVTGRSLSADPLMAYLEAKFSDVYGL
jgi:carboxypeptidase Taq